MKTNLTKRLNTVICGDALEELKTFPNDSIDCIITSPPYWQMRNYGWKGQWGLEHTYQAYLEKLWVLMDEIKRVLKPDGTVWINLGDTYFGSGNDSGKKQGRLAQNIRKVRVGEIAPTKANAHPDNKLRKKCQVLIPHRFAIGCIERGWILRNDIIWAKPNGAPESVKDRFSKKHEFIFLFAKQPDYYFDLDSVREEHKETSLLRNKYPQIAFGRDSNNKKISFGKGKKNGGQLKKVKLNPNGKNPGDVADFWSIPTRHGSAKHYATFNTDLTLKPILAGCPKGGIVLDPFCGTGTTGETALQLGRNFIGIEGKKEYCKIAQGRLSNFSLGDIDEKDIKLFTDASLLDLQDSILIEWISVSEDKRRKGLATNALIKELQQLKNDGISYIETAQTSSGSYLFNSLEKKGIIKEVDIHNLPVSEEVLNNSKSIGLKVYKITFSDLAGVQNLKTSHEEFINKVSHDLENKVHHNKISIEKLAASFGIIDKTEVKELTELAIVKRARKLAHSAGTIRERFDKIVDLYNSQVNLSHRTSQSILLRQYSTPAPIAYLAGVFCGIDKSISVFEPSAGNGLLTITANPEQCTVNELDVLRRRNLEAQGYRLVMNGDATRSFVGFEKKFDAVLTNPPFGVSETEVMYDTFRIKPLEHVMALRALDCMRDSGKAAIIIGGHTRWDEKGRIQAGKQRIFFNYLYSRYNVAEVINIDGHKLYSRQGTSFDVRLILIDGRKQTPSSAAPVFNPAKDVEIKTFDDLFERVMDATEQETSMKSFTDLETEALQLQSLFGLEDYDARIDSSINMHYYSQFKKAKQKTKSRKQVVIVKTDLDRYETYDEDADQLVNRCAFFYNKYHDGKERKIFGVSFPSHKLKEYKKELSRVGYRIIISDQNNSLGAPYEPASDACIVLNTQVPDSMAFETKSAIELIKKEVGGDIDNFVRHRLKYPTKAALCKVLSAEQIDAVAMAIYNIEARGQGMIIGDQTGIGKGRVAAGMIRYGVFQGVKPVFLTEKSNLFSDIYRDLVAIGSGHLKPFIVNSRESKTDIKDEDGSVIYQAPSYPEQQEIITSRVVPSQYDFIVGTYSQFNSPEKKPEKPNFLMAIAEENIFILDEAHNSSGSSNTGNFLQGAVSKTKGVVFLSATFAKRPDNMPIYAMKTAIVDCNMSRDELVEAITRGGVALQEVLSSQLVAEGQMLRRERSFEGVEVNYINLDDKSEAHKAIADNITEILRDIIAFQSNHVDEQVEELDKIAVAEGKEVEVREGTSQAGVDNLPYFSKVFQVINQMLFSLKAESVAERAIHRLKEGKKPIIAFASTMGSFIETMENEQGMPVGDGDNINADFSEVLKRGLDGILRYTEKDVDGNPIFKKFEVSELPVEGQAEYIRILNKIKAASTGITISPIDVIIKKLKDAGYSVAEVTGRKLEVQLNTKTGKGLVLSRKRINTNDAFRQFNNNEVDVLMINQSGSTGASAHAIPTAKVPKDQVKQRVMIVLQAELDINTEVQKRGRINRTGQILKPIYDYVTSAIPAEKRLMMMLQKKLKSLDANTTSNQKQSTKILDVPDFLNKYGDKIVRDYLMENKEVNELLDDPLSLESSKADSGSKDVAVLEDAAHKVSGRVAVLSTKMQQDFYNEISERYNDYVEYLKQVGEYDLEVEAMNLETETMSSKIIKMGKGSDSAFGDDSMLETVRANVLKKPFTKTELKNLINESLQGHDAKMLQSDLAEDFVKFQEKQLEIENEEINTKYDELIKNIPQEKAIKKLEEKHGSAAAQQEILNRTKELEQARKDKYEQVKRVFENRKQYLGKILGFFFVGRNLQYPVETYNAGNELVPSVFLGFVIDKKKKNPYAPSAIKLRFAIANSSKYLAIPASYSEDIMAIIGASSDTGQSSMDDFLKEWEEYTKQNNVDRRIRHIITGNLLQAFSYFKGKLVSYTTIDGKTIKGILMPENWNPGEQIQDRVVVPILKALPLIKSLTQNNQIVTNNGLSIFRTGENFKLIIAASRTRGGDIYLDKQILELVEKNNFEKLSDKMVAILSEKKIGELIEILQNNHGCSITIHSSQLKDLKTENVRYSNIKKIELPDEEKEVDETISILELEAEALTLELELLAA